METGIEELADLEREEQLRGQPQYQPQIDVDGLSFSPVRRTITAGIWAAFFFKERQQATIVRTGHEPSLRRLLPHAARDCRRSAGQGIRLGAVLRHGRDGRGAAELCGEWQQRSAWGSCDQSQPLEWRI